MSLPLSARAQQTIRGVAVVLVRRENDPLGRGNLSALQQALRELGWHEGRNLQVEVRWAGGDADLMREIATEFIKLKPDSGLEALRFVNPGGFCRNQRASLARLYRQHGPPWQQHHRL